MALAVGGWSRAPIILRWGLLAGAVLLGASPLARAQTAADCACGLERFAFDAADTDGDGLVSEAELARDAAAGFAGLDVDGDERLTPAELGPHDAALFEVVDADGDGVLTFTEVMTNKVRAFRAGDTNADGGLSFEEMVEEVSGP